MRGRPPGTQTILIAARMPPGRPFARRLSHTANANLTAITLLIMSSRKLLRASGALIAATLASGLVACAAETVRLAPESMPTMAPEQSADDACSATKAGIEALVDDARAQLKAAGSTVAAGEMPDLSGLAEQLHSSIDTIADGVSNAEVLAALDGIRTEVDGFAEIDPPESIVGMPGYLAELGGQAGELKLAAEALRSLCGTS